MSDEDDPMLVRRRQRVRSQRRLLTAGIIGAGLVVAGLIVVVAVMARGRGVKPVIAENRGGTAVVINTDQELTVGSTVTVEGEVAVGITSRGIGEKPILILKTTGKRQPSCIFRQVTMREKWHSDIKRGDIARVRGVVEEVTDRHLTLIDCEMASYELR